MRDRTWGLAAGAAATAAFLPAAAGGFVYDDHRFLADNPHLTRLSILWRAFADPSCQTADGTEAGLWRPLRTLSFALDRLLGATATWPHVENALLHGVGTTLVFAMLRLFGASRIGSLLGALLYALHPAQVECVAWISSRGDLLAAALVWAAIVLDHRGRAVAALFAGAAALLAKEQAVVWPALALLGVLLSGGGLREAMRRAAVPAALVGAFVVVRWTILSDPTQQGGLGGQPPRFWQMAAMLGHQAWFALVPVGALFDWQMPRGELPWPASIVALAACGAVAFRPTRIPAAWFLVALVPTLFIQAAVPLNILVADRFLLFALPALALGVARCVDAAGPLPAALAVLSCGALTETAFPTWRSDASLWSETATRVPGHARANAWLGAAALRAGDLEEAIRRLRIAVTSHATNAKARYQLALALEQLGKRKGDAQMVSDACDEYLRALQALVDARAESAGEVLLLATLAAADTKLAVYDDASAAHAALAILERPRPDVPADLRDAWNARVESLARSAGAHPLLGPEVADRVGSWGRVP
jgi:protein O-mannosyl-transferase